MEGQLPIVDRSIVGGSPPSANGEVLVRATGLPAFWVQLLYVWGGIRETLPSLLLPFFLTDSCMAPSFSVPGEKGGRTTPGAPPLGQETLDWT